jgi:hypothetical protein
MGNRDKELVMSDCQDLGAQAVGAVASTNIINFGKLGNLVDLWLHLMSREDFASALGATVKFDLEVAEDEAFNTNKRVVFSTGAIGKATLVSGYEIAKVKVPVGSTGYGRMNYTVAVGDLTAGMIDAELVDGVRIGAY